MPDCMLAVDSHPVEVRLERGSEGGREKEGEERGGWSKRTSE